MRTELLGGHSHQRSSLQVRELALWKALTPLAIVTDFGLPGSVSSNTSPTSFAPPLAKTSCLRRTSPCSFPTQQVRPRWPCWTLSPKYAVFCYLTELDCLLSPSGHLVECLRSKGSGEEAKKKFTFKPVLLYIEDNLVLDLKGPITPADHDELKRKRLERLRAIEESVKYANLKVYYSLLENVSLWPMLTLS